MQNLWQFCQNIIRRKNDKKERYNKTTTQDSVLQPTERGKQMRAALTRFRIVDKLTKRIVYAAIGSIIVYAIVVVFIVFLFYLISQSNMSYTL